MVENEALKKRVIEAIRQHNLQIDDDDPVLELAVMQQLLFDQHLGAVAELLGDQTAEIKQSGSSLTDRCNQVFVAFTERLKRVKLNAQLARIDRGLLKLILLLTFINSVGLLFVIGKILGAF